MVGLISPISTLRIDRRAISGFKNIDINTISSSWTIQNLEI